MRNFSKTLGAIRKEDKSNRWVSVMKLERGLCVEAYLLRRRKEFATEHLGDLEQHNRAQQSGQKSTPLTVTEMRDIFQGRRRYSVMLQAYAKPMLLLYTQCLNDGDLDQMIHAALTKSDEVKNGGLRAPPPKMSMVSDALTSTVASGAGASAALTAKRKLQLRARSTVAVANA
jgi:hypothetical protein